MRRMGWLVVVLAVAGCGHTTGSGPGAADAARLLASATARTVAARSATIKGEDRVDSDDGFHGVTARSTGALSLATEQGRLSDDGSRLIDDGSIEYRTFRVSFAGRRRWVRDRLAPQDAPPLRHLQFMLYLPTGAQDARSIGTAMLDGTKVQRIASRVDPALVTKKLPPWLAGARRFLIRNDYNAKPFDAVFWVDGKGRLRRIEADLAVPFGKARAKVVLRLDLDHFGTHVDVTPPPRSDTWFNCVGCR
jgi:hypothetical protein